MSQTETKPLKPTLALRDEFHQLVVRQLLRPYDGSEEELPGQVRYRYLVGRLAPRRAAGRSQVTIEAATELGQPDVLERHMAKALEAMRLCASDPLCAGGRPCKPSKIG